MPKPRDCISDEPIIRAVHRRLGDILLVVYALMVVYVSFVPFDFKGASLGTPGAGTVLGLHVARGSLPDIFANIGLYMPLGVLCFIAGMRRLKSKLLCGAAAVLAAGLLSYGVEFGQQWVASRVSSWPDVVANGLGAWLGVMAAGVWLGEIKRTLRRSHLTLARNWPLTVAKALACLILLLHLRPYDVVVDTFHTAADVRHADLSPMAGWRGLDERVAREVAAGRLRGMQELPRARWEYAIDRVVDVAGYAGLSILLAVGLTPQFRRRRGAMFAWIGFVVVSLAMMVVLFRVFLISHGVDTSHFYCGIVGWLVGCAMARWAHGRSPEAAGQSLTRVLSPRVAVVATAFTLATVLLYELVPFDFQTSSATAGFDSRFCAIPFDWHFAGRPNDAFYDISGDVLRYGAVGVCLALLMAHRTGRPWRRQLVAVVAITGVLCVALETLHFGMASRGADVTTLVIALAASFAGTVAVRWLSDFRVYASRAFAEDMLTRQLIEGATYDKSQFAEIAHRSTAKSENR